MGRPEQFTFTCIYTSTLSCLHMAQILTKGEWYSLSRGVFNTQTPRYVWGWWGLQNDSIHPCLWGKLYIVEVGVPLYVLEDGLFRVANWEDQTKEDLASKFCKRREKITEDRRRAFTRKITKSYHRLIGIFLFYLRRIRRFTLVGGPPEVGCRGVPGLLDTAVL